jgi:hypothetical protein
MDNWRVNPNMAESKDRSAKDQGLRQILAATTFGMLAIIVQHSSKVGSDETIEAIKKYASAARRAESFAEAVNDTSIESKKLFTSMLRTAFD